ncbi:MAG: pentapeptide repeat-containing protein [Pirellulales bacterium]
MTWRSCLFAVVAFCACLSISHAQIYRWDNGQVIPGTEEISLHPEVFLFEWDQENHNLRFGDFSGQLHGSTFADCWLDSARFVNASLVAAELARTTLVNADFTKADLTGAVFVDATLTDAVFEGALIKGLQLYDGTSNGFTQDQLYSTASYKYKDLRNIRFDRNDFTNWNFSGQNLAKSFLLSDFTDADLSGANLSGSSFSDHRGHATLTNADFTGAIVTETGFAFATQFGFTEQQLYSTHSYQAKNLTGIVLNGNNLTNWNFSNQVLQKAILSQSNLTNVNLEGADLTNGACKEFCVT